MASRLEDDEGRKAGGELRGKEERRRKERKKNVWSLARSGQPVPQETIKRLRFWWM
jgi:hypothetical protein